MLEGSPLTSNFSDQISPENAARPYQQSPDQIQDINNNESYDQVKMFKSDGFQHHPQHT